jgi:hypothetical protein
MATLSASNLTLADWAKRIDPQGDIPAVAELLSQTNEVLDDCVFTEGNLPTGHRVVIRTGLPTVYWRALNQGIATSKSTTAQVDESCGILESRSEVDKDLAMLNGNTAAFRLSESRAFLEAMSQEFNTKLFYGNTATDPKTILGFAPRYSDIGAGSPANSQNIIDGAGTDADLQTSVWLVVWGPETVFCPFPKGSAAGLLHRDLGEQTIYEAGGAGLRMQGFVDWYQWKVGVCVKDWRYAVRIANIDVSEVQSLTAEQAPTDFGNMIHLMTKAVYRIPNLQMGRPAFYMNRTVHEGLSRIAMEKSASALAVEDGLSQFGTPRAFMTFLGIPIRRVDGILNTEAVVS